MSRDTNFYYSFLVLRRSKRHAIVAVWDFCRAIDDAVDEWPTESAAEQAAAHARLQAWRDEIGRCFTNGVPEMPQGHALQPWIARFQLPRRPLEDLVDGVAMDIGPRRYATFGQLYQYCYRVASTVGLVCVQVFGCEEAASRDYAVDLGVALQLTNILRDIPDDLARGRFYVPGEDLRRFGCTEESIRTAPASAPVRALLRHQGARAREFYQRAHDELPRTEARRLVAAEIMGAIYLAILEEIERRDFDVFRERVRIPRPQRAWLAATTWARTITGMRGSLRETARAVSKHFSGPGGVGNR